MIPEPTIIPEPQTNQRLQEEPLSSRPLIQEGTPSPNGQTPPQQTNIVDYGFGEDINRRIEINYDPESARYPIPKYLKRITDTLFSKATAREIFMVKLESMSKLKSSKNGNQKEDFPCQPGIEEEFEKTTKPKRGDLKSSCC